MMPLKSYNRNLLRLVFKNYINGEFLQFDLLKEDEPFNENTIGMKIAPKINAVGRLLENDEINNVVKLFVSTDRQIILNYIDWLNNINEERKNISTFNKINTQPKNLKEIDIRKNEPIYTVGDKVLEQACVSSISISSDKKYFAVGSHKGNIYICKMVDGTVEDSIFNRTTGSILAVAWKPFQSQLYVGDSNGYLTIWGTK